MSIRKELGSKLRKKVLSSIYAPGISASVLKNNVQFLLDDVNKDKRYIFDLNQQISFFSFEDRFLPSLMFIRKNPDHDIPTVQVDAGAVKFVINGADVFTQGIVSCSRDFDENTIIIFTSDHADLMGDHGLLFKGPAHYQGLVKVPLLWKVPGYTPAKSISQSLVSSIDIPITILNLLGIKDKFHPPGMQGYDISPILENPSLKLRDHCIIEEDEDAHRDSKKEIYRNIRVRTMITEKYRITIYQGYENTGDLFDLMNDPQELKNLWYDKDYNAIRDKLIKKMFDKILDLQDRYPKKQAQA